MIGGALRWAAALAFAFAAGVALSYGQTYAARRVGSALQLGRAYRACRRRLRSLAAKRWWGATLLGALAAPLLVAGYYVTSHVRGFAGNASWIALWGTAGVIAGATMGLAWWCLRARVSPPLRAAGAAVFPGILVGEALHGITRIADTTPAAYWWTQAAVGVAVLLVLAAWRVPTWPSRLLAVLFAGAIAVAVYTVYGVA